VGIEIVCLSKTARSLMLLQETNLTNKVTLKALGGQIEITTARESLHPTCLIMHCWALAFFLFNQR
jgi:hypothetical protein